MGIGLVKKATKKDALKTIRARKHDTTRLKKDEDVNESDGGAEGAELAVADESMKPTEKRLSPKLAVCEAEAREIQTFQSLGLHADICRIISMKKWKSPTPIQEHIIPVALKGRDVIGLAVTGSGKTGAYVLPIVHKMLEASESGDSMESITAMAISPTRELCLQISEEFRYFGISFQLKIVTLVGGLSAIDQTKELARQPQIVVGTPGRVVDHIQNTKGFDVTGVRFLVLDEADRLLSMDYEEDLLTIIKECSHPEKQTFLFSATMTSKLSKLEKASLKPKPVKVQVNDKTQTSENLSQFIVVIPIEEKFMYLPVLLKKFNAYKMIVFCNTCKVAHVLSIYLNKLRFNSVVLTGDMDQRMRLQSMNKFKSNPIFNVLLTTDVASRGMDIPSVHYVINFDVPNTHKDYIHRVGRTARAGKIGSAFTFVTKFDVQQYKAIEDRIFGDSRERWPKPYEEIKPVDYEVFSESYREARQAASKEYEELKKRKGKKKKNK